ncbi:MAG: CRISPR-associated protein Cas4, partial [Candidatus Margulisiibacteriota bacterium]
MIPEENWLKLSALQHFAFCPRQCALIHIEQYWVENLWTAEGRLLHERVHEDSLENRKQVRIEKNVPLSSEKLGIIGQSDVIEFRRLPNSDQIVVYPIEYKRGKPKTDHCDIIQLCAQALCLEEMMNVSIPKGALFYGETKHRQEIEFDEA